MKNKVFSFTRSYDPSTTQQALRILLSMGISRDQIRVLGPSEASERNSLNPPEMKSNAFSGANWGALAGLGMGGLIFVVPKFIWNYAYEDLLAVVGTVIFIGVGVSIGTLVALRLSRRKSGNHLIGPDEQGVFVTVHEGQEEQLNRAKDEFSRYESVKA